MAVLKRVFRPAVVLSALRSYVFPSSSVSLYHFLSTSSADDLKDAPVFHYLRLELGFSESEICTAARRQLELARSLKNARNVVHVFRESGCTDDQIKKAVLRLPGILSRKPDFIKSKFELFTSIGFSENEVANMLCTSPRILNLSLDQTLAPRILYLHGILNGTANFVRVLKSNPCLLASNTERTVMRMVKILLESGVEGVLLVRLMKRSPRALCVSIESMKSYIEYVGNMGIEGPSRKFVDALASFSNVGSIKKMEEKFRILESLGLQRDDVKETFTKHPLAFCTSTDKIRRITRFLVDVAGYSPNFIVDYPFVLTYSLERRLKPWYEAFQYLKRIDPSYVNCKFSKLLKQSESNFITSLLISSSHAETLLKILKSNART